MKFCTCSDSNAVGACAKLYGVQILIFEVMGERNLERNFGAVVKQFPDFILLAENNVFAQTFKAVN